MEQYGFFDIMAKAIRFIENFAENSFWDRFESLKPESHREIRNRILNEFPELSSQNDSDEIIAGSHFEHGFFERLNHWVDEKKESRELGSLVYLLQILDRRLSARSLYISVQGLQDCLNSNANETHIQLLPRYACSWEHKSRGAQYERGLTNYMKYYYYIDENALHGYRIQHYFVDENLFREARKRGYLRIGLTPLMDHGSLRLRFYERNEICYFSVDGHSNEESVQAAAVNIMEKAKEQGIDILVYPEMMGSQQIYHEIKELLKSFTLDGKYYPVLTVLPTWWENHHNRTEIIDDLGDKIMSQEKQQAFTYPDRESGKNYLEDIFPDKTIHLLHCPGIGRMAIMICKDMLMKEYLRIYLDILKVTLLLVPSFSTGSYNFTEIMQMGRVSDCIICWINTCSAETIGASKENLEIIGACLRCGKQHKDIENGCFLYKRGEISCGKQSNAVCENCILICKIQFGGEASL